MRKYRVFYRLTRSLFPHMTRREAAVYTFRIYHAFVARKLGLARRY